MASAAQSPSDPAHYESRRQALRQRYLGDTEEPVVREVATSGVDHLALICSDIEATIEFYTEVIHMRLTKVIQNRDAPTSTHLFLDMGGGNQLAFFDFPAHGPAQTVRGVGAMHHIALKATPENYRQVVDTLKERGIEHSVHGGADRGSVYFRDPDNILLEVTTGYD